MVSKYANTVEDCEFKENKAPAGGGGGGSANNDPSLKAPPGFKL